MYTGVCFFLFSYPLTWLLQVTDVSALKIILAAHHDIWQPPALDLPENCYFAWSVYLAFPFVRIAKMYYFHRYLARKLAFRLPSPCTNKICSLLGYYAVVITYRRFGTTYRSRDVGKEFTLYWRINKNPTRCNSTQSDLFYCKITLHVSGVNHTHHQEY